MQSKFDDEDDLLSAGLEILESKKALSRSTYCLSCDSQMRVGPLLICAECLSDDCDTFEELTKKD